jgi:hypothetical protein
MASNNTPITKRLRSSNSTTTTVTTTTTSKKTATKKTHKVTTQVSTQLTEFLEKNFNKSFKMLQALAYLPPDDVRSGFKLVCLQAPNVMKPILLYIENNYIGTSTKPARFPINLWNLNFRIKNGLKVSTNSVESWHSRITPDIRPNQSTNQVVELIRKEQSETEAQLVKLLNGETLCQPVSANIRKRDEQIRRVVSAYVYSDNDDITQFLNSISQLLLIE